MEYELIHINLALAKYSLSSEEMKSFWELEKPIYEMAKAYSGFIRDIEFADRFSVFPEPNIFNASAWKNIEDLKQFVYTGTHASAMKNRKRWFTDTSLAKYALFWSEAGKKIAGIYAAEKLKFYSKNGPTPEVFDFKTVYAKGAQPNN